MGSVDKSKRLSPHAHIFETIFAGKPYARWNAGMFSVKTEPAPMIEKAPMDTSDTIVVPAPIEHPSLSFV